MASTMDREGSEMLEQFYCELDGNKDMEAYHDRHGTQTLGILTVYDDEKASLVAEHLRERIEGKIVVEIGGGIGLLAMYLAGYAKHVFCFEVDPAWMSCFVHVLYKKKPANLTYIFGRAQDMAFFRADVALFCTHSGHDSLQQIGGMFAPEVIDVYRELVGKTDVIRSNSHP